MLRHAAIALLVLCLTLTVAHAALWAKYVAPDKSFSFHYPAGWKLQAQDAAILINNPNTAEQLLFMTVPVEPGQNARAVAESVLKLLQRSTPDLKTDKLYEDTDDVVLMQTSYTEGGKLFVVQVEVIKQGEGAHWFAYSAPREEYALSRATALLQGLRESLATGSDSKLPAIVAPPLATAKLQRNAEAFVFVIGFAAGTTFGAQQEQTIIGELLSEWKPLPPEEQEQYDGYFAYKLGILGMGQEDLAKVRGELEATVQELLAQSGDSPSIKIIREALNGSQKVVVEGEPPLTEVTARSYAELVAYATAVQSKPKAMPADVSPVTVKEVRTRLQATWTGLTKEEREAILTTPAVWVSTREVVREGSGEEKMRLRENLANLALKPEAPTPAAGQTKPADGAPNSGGTLQQQLTREATRHQVLMQMQQATFNTQRWCRGYSGWSQMGARW